ncbi:SDR family oxidoreductase [Chlorogloea sp. CCALA 695]|uniref:SDR family oxidoreductase n=1 Tax=Chlorogloea sp. CCALA 695 TaxID=2107693 RepID=UPI000D070A39|nr:SDR family oxidoreductase [Chlorogloea sp. CCALA 695]PSB29120.1 NAD(P)-dependent oxidoreductase [Chlorogloea sp. CCALA 695]
MSNTILVTGATGNVGSQVVQQLVASGIMPRVAVRSMNKAESLKKAGAEPVEMDLERPETVQSALTGVEKVFLVSPFVPNMVELTAILIETAKRANVQQIVKLSALAQPGIALSKWHSEMENAITSSGISFTFLRPNGFMQNFVNAMAETIKSDKAFYLNAGDGKVSFVDTRDIASVAVAALITSGHEGQSYTITGAEALSHAESASILSQVLGRTINYVDVPEDVVRQGMQGAGMPEPTVNALLELYASYKAGQAATVSPVVEQVTGKQPISFEQFAKDYAEVWQ